MKNPVVADIEHHATPIDEMTHGTTKMANPTLIQIREFDQTPQILQSKLLLCNAFNLKSS